MRNLRFQSAPVAWLLLLALPAAGGQFRYGIGRTEQIKVSMPTPPAVRIGRKILAIDVKDGSGVNPPVTALQALLDQVFAQTFTIVQANGEVTLRVAVTHFVPPEAGPVVVRQQTKVPVLGQDGTPQFDPQTGQPMMQPQEVAVESWVVRGEISARVEVVDSSGALLDGFAPNAVTSQQAVISVNGQDRVDRTKLPSKEQVQENLFQVLAQQFRRRYCPPVQEMEIPLAVDDELRAANKFAKDGNFQTAAKAWQEATIANPKNQGDKPHNLGAVHEAQVYDLLLKQTEPAKAEQYLLMAAKYYDEAQKLDPEEKYIQRAAQRVRKAMLLVASLKELEATRQRALEARAAPSSWPPTPGATTSVSSELAVPVSTAPVVEPDAGAAQGGDSRLIVAGNPAGEAGGAPGSTGIPVDAAAGEALQQAISDPRPDLPQEAEFRVLVRLRMRALAGPAADDQQRRLEGIGSQAYSLTALQSKRVVLQEAQAYAVLQPKLTAYRETLAAFAGDGRVTLEERNALLSLARNLRLGQNDVKEVESVHQFKE